MNKRMLYRSIVLVVAIILVSASTVRMAHASNLCVHPQGAGQCYTTIQAAVDAANAGDQIVIRPGRYMEQVTIIDKDLTLIGREGAVVQAFPGMEETLSEVTGGAIERPIIGVFNADVTIRGLTIDGANLQADNPFMSGIVLFNAGGMIQNNVIRNVGFGTPTLPLDPEGNPLYQGDAILVITFSDTSRTLTIEGNRAVNFNNNGITAISFNSSESPVSPNLTMHIARNTIIGAGPNDVVDQFGIYFISEGFPDPSMYATVTIENNHVRDLTTLAPYPLLGSGIVTANTNNMSIANNDVENVDIGIEAAFAYNSQIMSNQLRGTGEVSSGTVGIRVSGSDIQVNRNRIRQFETGIGLHVAHPFFGLASAVNTSLNNNQFDNVGVEIMTGPGDTGLGMAAAASSKFESYRSRFQR